MKTAPLSLALALTAAFALTGCKDETNYINSPNDVETGSTVDKAILSTGTVGFTQNQTQTTIIEDQMNQRSCMALAFAAIRSAHYASVSCYSKEQNAITAVYACKSTDHGYRCTRDF